MKDDKKEPQLGDIIQLRAKSCFHNGTFLVDERSNSVQCGTCKETLNPIWVLGHISRNSSRYKVLLEEAKAEFRIIKKAIERAKRIRCEHCRGLTVLNYRHLKNLRR